MIVETLKANLNPQADGVDNLTLEQHRILELEHENVTLKARLAEIEARLNALTDRR